MVITVKCKMTGDDIGVFNLLAVWCFERNITLQIDGESYTKTITMSGDPLVLADMLVHLTEKKHGV